MPPEGQLADGTHTIMEKPASVKPLKAMQSAQHETNPVKVPSCSIKISAASMTMCLLLTTTFSFLAGRHWNLRCAGNDLSGKASSFATATHTLYRDESCSKGTCPILEVINEHQVMFDPPLRQESERRNRPTRIDPSAAHVMMDILFVDAEFLSDEGRIRRALETVIWEASAEWDLGLQTYHCHRLKNSGISCIAMLAGGHHVSVATQPQRHSILLDCFAAGEESLAFIVPLLQMHFGIPMKGRSFPRVRWNHVLRGTRERLNRWRRMEQDISDLYLDVKNAFYYKEEVASIKSAFQHIDIWDFLDTRVAAVVGFERSLGSENTYESNHPELYQRNRALFLDGVLQSTTRGDPAYHEALVHPAMFAHEHGPKRVAIIGGGEGATLREVLKHKTVEHCKMIEIDKAMVDAARKYLPSLNNCTDLVGSSENCFDDERTDLLCQDAFGWFMDRFTRGGKLKPELKTDPFDVIVMDALDPEDDVEFAVNLYTDVVFWKSLYDALTDDGVLSMQLGASPLLDDPSEENGGYHNRYQLLRTVERVGFVSMHVYEEFHCDFQHPWSFLVACKSDKCQKHWYANEAEVGRKILQRILPTQSGTPALRFFDGATMSTYQRPTRAWEAVFCRQVPTPRECNQLTVSDFYRDRVIVEYFESIQTGEWPAHSSPRRTNCSVFHPVRDRHDAIDCSDGMTASVMP